MNKKYYLHDVSPSLNGDALVIKIKEEDDEIKLVVLNNLIDEIEFKDKLKPTFTLEIEEFCVLSTYDGYTKAILKGIYLLGYSQNTKKGISRKLIGHGFTKEESEYASLYLERHGYINEHLQCELLFDTLVNKKLLGKSRVVKELYAKGFSKETIGDVIQNSDVDYDEICLERMNKQSSKFPLENKEKQKLISSFMYYGFNISNIEYAYRKILEDL